MKITIQNTYASVTCQTLGAELLSYQTADGKEYMWQKDPAYWPKTSPVLFPYIGAVPQAVLIHGKAYEVPRHGFVKDAEFTVAEQKRTMSFWQPVPQHLPLRSIRMILPLLSPSA